MVWQLPSDYGVDVTTWYTQSIGLGFNLGTSRPFYCWLKPFFLISLFKPFRATFCLCYLLMLLYLRSSWAVMCVISVLFCLQKKQNCRRQRDRIDGCVASDEESLSCIKKLNLLLYMKLCRISFYFFDLESTWFEFTRLVGRGYVANYLEHITKGKRAETDLPRSQNIPSGRR